MLQSGLEAGGAVTIEELIWALQGTKGSTPQACRSAADHLVRIGGECKLINVRCGCKKITQSKTSARSLQMILINRGGWIFLLMHHSIQSTYTLRARIESPKLIWPG